MKFIYAIFRFYIHSSIHVGLAVTCLAVVTVFEFGFVPEPTLLLFIFFGTIVGYNFVKYAGISNHHNLNITPHINLIRGFSILCVSGAGYFGLMLPMEVLIMAGVFGVLTLLYAIPLYKSRNLRSLYGIKIFIIAIVWIGVSVLLPLEYHNLNFRPKVFYQCLEIFFFVIALTLPFEIRDLKHDKTDLGTLPQKLGVSKTKWLGVILLVISGIIAINQTYLADAHLYASLITFGLTLVLLMGAREEQGEFYASFFVESMPIVWLFLMLWL
ncbi:UbiA prenyltransferase family protein [Gracilimonas halophila]|uniref:Prenyltransferase n=1 Tax=Gracilimonas halophila TaxID=1834464 RepID=A0ABW5JK11_9BACT